jgi:hypothetical protein
VYDAHCLIGHVLNESAYMGSARRDAGMAMRQSDLIEVLEAFAPPNRPGKLVLRVKIGGRALIKRGTAQLVIPSGLRKPFFVLGIGTHCGPTPVDIWEVLAEGLEMADVEPGQLLVQDDNFQADNSLSDIR